MELDNVRFVAGHRRGWLCPDATLDELRALDLDRCCLAEVGRGLVGRRDPALVHAGLLHLLWRGELVTDLTTPLGGRHVLRRRSP